MNEAEAALEALAVAISWACYQFGAVPASDDTAAGVWERTPESEREAYRRRAARTINAARRISSP